MKFEKITNETHCVITIVNDESATADDRHLPYIEGMTGWTQEVVKALLDRDSEDYDDMDVPEYDEDTPLQKLLEIYEYLNEDWGYPTFNMLCVVKREHLPKLQEKSNWALNEHGDDSGWYVACEEFDDLVKGLADQCIVLN